jgi:HAD superfamily hydrolase (TIGR01509 family)
MEIDCFIFDFDGTLARSETVYHAAFRHSVKLHLGIEVAQCDLDTFWNQTPGEVLGRYSEEHLPKLLAAFEEHYYANHHRHLEPYEGVAELLAHLNSLGAGVGVASLKPRRAGERELEVTGLRGLVHSAVWGDDVERPKPEPDAVFRLLASFGASADRVIVVGDSPADIRMGRAAGTRTAAALWNGCGATRLLEANPDLRLHKPGDLLSALSRNGG